MAKKSSAYSTYCRSYIVTLGLTFVAGSVFIWQHENSETAAPWTLLGFALLCVFLLGGAALVLFGLLGPAGKMDSWAEVMSRHEASLIILAVAYPVYLIISPFYSRR